MLREFETRFCKKRDFNQSQYSTSKGSEFQVITTYALMTKNIDEPKAGVSVDIHISYLKGNIFVDVIINIFMFYYCRCTGRRCRCKLFY